MRTIDATVHVHTLEGIAVLRSGKGNFFCALTSRAWGEREILTVPFRGDLERGGMVSEQQQQQHSARVRSKEYESGCAYHT